MDWNPVDDEERTALTRIVSLLLALADLVERTITRSPAVRAFVLWLLLPAEAVARNLVTCTLAPCPFRHAGFSRADALRLARRLRNLARAVDRRAMSDGVCQGDVGQPEPAWAWLCRTPQLADAQSLIGNLAFPPAMRIAFGIAGFDDTS